MRASCEARLPFGRLWSKIEESYRLSLFGTCLFPHVDFEQSLVSRSVAVYRNPRGLDRLPMHCLAIRSRMAVKPKPVGE
jgi:hypothetical protein